MLATELDAIVIATQRCCPQHECAYLLRQFSAACTASAINAVHILGRMFVKGRRRAIFYLRQHFCERWYVFIIFVNLVRNSTGTNISFAGTNEGCPRTRDQGRLLFASDL